MGPLEWLNAFRASFLLFEIVYGQEKEKECTERLNVLKKGSWIFVLGLLCFIDDFRSAGLRTIWKGLHGSSPLGEAGCLFQELLNLLTD